MIQRNDKAKTKKVGFVGGNETKYCFFFFVFFFSPQLIKVVIAPGSYAQSEIVHIKYHWRDKTARVRQLLQRRACSSIKSWERRETKTNRKNLRRNVKEKKQKETYCAEFLFHESKGIRWLHVQKYCLILSLDPDVHAASFAHREHLTKTGGFTSAKKLFLIIGHEFRVENFKIAYNTKLNPCFQRPETKGTPHVA